jgi:1-acyl-sn-glycerol-3-phosphate acyltransferase
MGNIVRRTFRCSFLDRHQWCDHTNGWLIVWIRFFFWVLFYIFPGRLEVDGVAKMEEIPPFPLFSILCCVY